jgi:hypothetical protein
LTPAREQLHRAIQSLARATRSALPAQPGDLHTSLGWDDDAGTLWTRRFPGGMRLGIRMRDLTLLARSAGRGDAALNLSGQFPDQADDWARKQLVEAGADVESFGEPLPYEIPDASGRRHFAAAGDALTELANWFANGYDRLTRFAVAPAGLDLDEEAVRCWPHHFDLGAIRFLEGGDPETARSISIGMSPGDASHDEPYFYVTPWPRPAADELPQATVGRWHTAGFTSLVLTAGELDVPDPGAVVGRFLSLSTAVCRELLG